MLAVGSLDDFGFPYDRTTSTRRQRHAQARLVGPPSLRGAARSPQPTLEYIGNSGGRDAPRAPRTTPALNDAYDLDTGARKVFSQTYDDVGRSLARDLREVAKVINGVRPGRRPGVHARFFQLEQRRLRHALRPGRRRPNGQHFGLHAEVGDVAEGLLRRLADMGVADKRRPSSCGASSAGASSRTTAAPTTARRARCSSSAAASTAASTATIPNIDDAALDDEGNTIYTQDTPRRLPLDRLPRRLRHDPEALAQHAAATILDVLTLDSGDPATRWTAGELRPGIPRMKPTSTRDTRRDDAATAAALATWPADRPSLSACSSAVCTAPTGNTSALGTTMRSRRGRSTATGASAARACGTS